jgi:hypothetical protein
MTRRYQGEREVTGGPFKNGVAIALKGPQRVRISQEHETMSKRQKTTEGIPGRLTANIPQGKRKSRGKVQRAKKKKRKGSFSVRRYAPEPRWVFEASYRDKEAGRR